MLVKLVEVQRGLRGGTSKLREVYLNPLHIISISEDVGCEFSLNEATQMGLVDGAAFTTVVIQEGNTPRSLLIVGTPSDVYNKINKKQVLKG